MEKVVVKKVAVASGKGGTGKTLLSTSLALVAGEILFVDCDVEEPNSHIFLNPQVEEVLPVKKMVPSFNLDLCDLCKKCQEVCQFGAIVVTKKNVISFPELCHSCYACIDLCPRKAITESFREVGTITKGRFNGGRFLSGKLNIGEPMATPIIRKLKEEVERSNSPVILDAPPGSSCPVVETLKGCDYALLVSEPTPFGIHDVSILFEVIKDMGIPGGLVINRKMESDEHYKRLISLAEDRGIPVLAEIPLEREIAHLYSQGKNLFYHKEHRRTVERIAEEVLS